MKKNNTEIPQLTDEEKIEFCAKHKTKQLSISNRKEFAAFIAFFAGTFTAIIWIPAIAIGLNLYSWLFLSIVSAGIIASATSVFIVGNKEENTKIIKASNGKLNYKKFWKLYKSGEYAKWQEQYKEQIQQRVNEINGVKVEEYIQDSINKIIKENPNAQIDEQKILESIKNRIEKK